MIKQNKTKLQFILGGALLVSMAVTGCNNSGDAKETKKDSATEDTTAKFTPPVMVKDTADTMEKTPGNQAPGNDVKPQ